MREHRHLILIKHNFAFLPENKMKENSNINHVYSFLDYFNLFVPNAPFFYPLKTSENRKIFCFQGVEKRSIGNKWVKFLMQACIFCLIVIVKMCNISCFHFKTPIKQMFVFFGTRQSFPNGVDWWGTIWAKWPKTA